MDAETEILPVELSLACAEADGVADMDGEPLLTELAETEGEMLALPEEDRVGLPVALEDGDRVLLALGAGDVVTRSDPEVHRELEGDFDGGADKDKLNEAEIDPELLRVSAEEAVAAREAEAVRDSDCVALLLGVADGDEDADSHGDKDADFRPVSVPVGDADAKTLADACTDTEEHAVALADTDALRDCEFADEPDIPLLAVNTPLGKLLADGCIEGVLMLLDETLADGWREGEGMGDSLVLLDAESVPAPDADAGGDMVNVRDGEGVSDMLAAEDVEAGALGVSELVGLNVKTVGATDNDVHSDGSALCDAKRDADEIAVSMPDVVCVAEAHAVIVEDDDGDFVEVGGADKEALREELALVESLADAATERESKVEALPHAETLGDADTDGELSEDGDADGERDGSAEGVNDSDGAEDEVTEDSCEDEREGSLERDEEADTFGVDDTDALWDSRSDELCDAVDDAGGDPLRDGWLVRDAEGNGLCDNEASDERDEDAERDGDTSDD